MIRRVVSAVLIAASGLALGYAGAAATEGAAYDRHVQQLERHYQTLCPQEDSCGYSDHMWQPEDH